MTVCTEMNKAPEFGDNLVEQVYSDADAQVAQMIAFGMSEEEALEMVEES